MTKRILLINSGNDESRSVIAVVKRWLSANADIVLWTSNDDLKSFAKLERLSCVDYRTSLSSGFDLMTLLQTWQKRLLLFFLNWKSSINAVIMVSSVEKLCFTSLAYRLGIKVLWLEEGMIDYYQLKPSKQSKLRQLSSMATVLAVNQVVSKKLVDFGYDEKTLKSIPCCVFSDSLQGDLFNNLARHFKLRKDYFTIGAKVDWSNSIIAESLIKALKQCLEVSPFFQLVLLGDGPGREQARWLVKRLHLETYVWLVGKQEKDEKWFDSFQAFIMASRFPSWDYLTLGNMAIASNLPLMVSENCVAEAYIDGGYALGLNLSDNMAVSQIWLGLSQDDNFKKELTNKAKVFNKEIINLDVVADRLLAII